MRFAFFTALLFFGYFVVFQVTPVDSDALFAAFGDNSESVAGNGAAVPIAPMVNRKTTGGKLFMDNCARCHSPNLQKTMTGPALWGVGDRVERELLADWIKNSQKVLETGNKYFNDLRDDYNGAAMDPMPHLKPAEIEAIIDELTKETI